LESLGVAVRELRGDAAKELLATPEQVLAPREGPEDFGEHRRQIRKLADEDLDVQAACRAVLEATLTEKAVNSL
jgi:hypothetical protein